MARYMYEQHIRHDGLNAYKHVRAPDPYTLEQKVRSQLAIWDEQWRKKSAAAARSSRIASKKDEAIERTDQAREALESLDNFLRDSLKHDPKVDWNTLKSREAFNDAAPRLQLPPRPTIGAYGEEPRPSDPQFEPQFGFLDKLSSSRAEAKHAEAKKRFDLAHNAWCEAKKRAEADLAVRTKAWEAESARIREAHRDATAAWENRKAEFEASQRAANEQVEKRRAAYESGASDGVADYCEVVLESPEYPETFPQDAEVQYVADTRTLVVDYALPAPEHLPTLKEVRFVQSRDEIVEVPLSEAAQNKLYDHVLYQIVLRAASDLFRADYAKGLDAVVFNGWVNAVDRTTGKAVNSCVLSLQAKRDELLALNLADVDPKACFKALKGVGSSKLSGLAAIAPILKLDKEDRRFVTSYDVKIAEGDNLAAMDWEDFEHLIRELFEKEFTRAGGEVKITRASRDGGVDAVVFDPDVIRGGKIVIQAKRYTNTVDVSAVRDLYGTVLNEGANKGILVTTADYGPDAYAFAKDKPLTLLNGANLLHLLEKHGHKSRIDLKEARLLQSEKKRTAP